MASPTDVRLFSQIELIKQKSQQFTPFCLFSPYSSLFFSRSFPANIYETLAPLNGQVNHNTLAYIRRANVALEKWYADCDELHSASPALYFST
jgi:hypothetical protein